MSHKFKFPSVVFPRKVYNSCQFFPHRPSPLNVNLLFSAVDALPFVLRLPLPLSRTYYFMSLLFAICKLKIPAYRIRLMILNLYVNYIIVESVVSLLSSKLRLR